MSIAQTQPEGAHRARVRRGLILAASLVLGLLGAGPVQAQCNPTVACCRVTNPGGEPGCAGAGNPINVITGNKYQREVDLPALPGVLGLEIVRHYNSAYSTASGRAGALGRGWKLGYETELIIGATRNRLTVAQADGALVHFVKGIADPTRYITTDPAHGSITATAQGSRHEYLWTRTDGQQWSFDAAGRLTQIKAATGEFVSFTRDGQGALVRVTDPQGRSLQLSEPAQRAGVGMTIDSPVGRFVYERGATSLVKVTLPGGVSRLYHYEDKQRPGLLTGISVAGTGSDGRAMNQRIGTYGYDAQGRGVLSVKGEPARWETDKDGKRRQVEGTGIEQITLEYGNGQTTLTNSLGLKTVYAHATIAGENRLLEVRGAGCATCSEPNVRYGHDKQGRVTETTKLDDNGRPIHATRTRFDPFGRAVSVSRIAYPEGKAQAPQQLVRYEYRGQAFAPTLVARPSVIVGKEHTLRVAYNDAGQRLSVTESGFSPIDDKGQLVKDGEPIRRTTTYAYTRINGRSVLTQIDGPLPNGPTGSPADSDITRAVWDAGGNHVIGWTTAGDFTSTIAYDPHTGLIAKVKNAQGEVTEFTHGSAGQPVRMATHGPGWTQPQVRSIKYDALGHGTQVGAGSDADNSYRAQAQHEFDVAGRLLWSATALGVLQHNRYDAESRLIESGRYSSAVAQVQSYAYDASGRITQVIDDNGATLRIGYDDRGRPRSLTDALGRVHEPGSSKTDAARPPRSHKLRDDFGRIVITLSPDSGTSIHRFDEADRLIAGNDAQGNVASYDYDAAGRIARQRITDKRSGQTTETRWRYAGKRLVALEHPTQSERYEHDARGLLVAKVVTVRRDDGSELTSVTRYGWNDDGVLQSTSLPDGSYVQYQRNGQGQVVALQRSRIQTSWLQWLLPAQTLVKDLQRDLVGLKGYSAGNGIQASTQRSREGTLARIVYRNTRQPVKSVAALRIQDILGIVSAQAAAPAASAPIAQAATAPADAKLPGALSQPADPQAFMDHRYLWDAQGNLLYAQAKASQSAYAYDARDRLVVAHSDTSTSRYHYDASGRRVLSQEGITNQEDLQTHTRKALYEDGNHRWLGEPGQTSYDAAGQLSRIGQREYVWDATGRLIEVRQEDRTLARYRYSHRGERISKTVGAQSTGYLYDNRELTAELDARGHITRQYVYLADQPIAVIDTPQGRALSAEDAGTLRRIARDLRIAISAWFGSDERIAWLHANHLGAIEAATDEQGHIVWQASYEPFGATHVGKGELVLNLRLPGQYEDAETGLYYNKHRYYDPNRGEYLTPDPLGTPDGPNSYAYVNYNPLKYVDPDGLVLFAFDGTDNTDDEAWLAAHNSSLSNVVLFRDAYAERRRYVTGVGTDHAGRDNYGDIIAANFNGLGGRIPDRGGNYSGPTRIDRMRLYFAEEANAIDDNEVMQVDIVGFSRGAAEARDFANRLVTNTRNGWYRYEHETGQVNPRTLLPIVETRCQRVNFRFMGLWDTVLSTNRSGTAYNLGIPAQFSYVAQAVALNEYRSAPAGVNANVSAFTRNFPYWNNTRAHLPEDNHYGGFPLESIGASSNTPGRVRIERGFIGAHADIGGGYGANENGLASVALSWMVAQAQVAGVNMNAQAVRIDMNNPVIHDQSNALRVGNPLTTPNFQAPGTVYGTNTYAVEDRLVNGGRGGGTQRTQTFGAPEPGGNRSMTNVDTHPFISYTPRNTANDTRRTTDIPEIRNLQNRTGTVDMQSYMSWLRQHGYVFAGEW